MRALVLALAIVGVACAQAGTEDQATKSPPKDASAPSDASTDVIAIDGFDDVPPGTIFDAVDDAPCTPGSKAACKTSCGTLGDAPCVAGDYGKCGARAGDPCLGLDCAGKGDGLEHTYYKDLDGDGYAGKETVQACTAPPHAYSTSTDCDDTDPNIHPGAAEICNLKDDNCNGMIDEGVPHVVDYLVSFGSIPGCNTADLASCKRAAYDWCRAKLPCYAGGFGPVEVGTGEGYFVCLGPGILSGTWADVTSAQPACSSDSMAGLRVCDSGVHRAGRKKGHQSAILQLHAPGDWSFLMLDSDRATDFAGVAFSELTAKHAGCTYARVDALDCNAAVHRWCSDKGYVSGYGPVEYSAAGVEVVCVK